MRCFENDETKTTEIKTEQGYEECAGMLFRGIDMKALYILLVIVVVMSLAVIFSFTNPSGQAAKSSLPFYASSHPLIKEAYTFAMDNPEQLNGVNCYCGCMQHVHDGRIHRRGLLDCFMKEDGSFDRHASTCDMCIKDALEVKQMAAEGKSKSEIKSAIDSKYR